MVNICPECKSSNLIKFGKKWHKNKETGKREQVIQYQCKDCGRITILPLREGGNG